MWERRIPSWPVVMSRELLTLGIGPSAGRFWASGHGRRGFQHAKRLGLFAGGFEERELPWQRPLPPGPNLLRQAFKAGGRVRKVVVGRVSSTKEETKNDVCVHLELAPGALCYSLSVCCRPCALKEPLCATLLEPLYKRVYKVLGSILERPLKGELF